MSVHRVIHRLDFQLNPTIADTPGALMKLITTAGAGGFPEVQDVQAKRMLVASSKSEKTGAYRHLTVEPIAITFSLEMVEGVDLAQLFDQEDFKFLLTVVDAIQNHCKIHEYVRSGLRVFLLDKVDLAGDSVHVVNGLLDNRLLMLVGKSLGDIKDVGISFDGAHDDKINYHARFGPFIRDEATKYFEKLKSSDLPDANLIFDIDLYEQGFTKHGERVGGWARTLHSRFMKTVNGIEGLLKEISV